MNTRLRPPGALRRLLDPESVAIVGATPRAGAFGERVMANLAPFGGRVHLINSRYEKIGETPCHPSLSALPEVPDCVVVTVPREAVEAVVREAAALGVGGLIVFASGYAETGKPGRAEQQAALTAIARDAGIPLVGPNCIGVATYAKAMRITFMPPPEILPKIDGRAVGIVSQSGALGFAMEQASRRGIAISHVLTSGNSSDVDMADYVAHLADDPNCAAIALLFEGMAEPRRLMAAAERARAAGKVVVACKLATGEYGAQAALSHTGSLAGSHAVYRAAFAHAGVVLVEDMAALMETAAFFAKVPPPQARGIAVMATSGGAAIMAADKAEIHGVALPQPDAPAREILAARIPEFGSPRNPCDITAQVLTDPEMLPSCADALLDDANFGALVIPSVYATASATARLPYYETLIARTGKPVINVWLTDWLEGPGAAACEASPSVPLFRSMDRAFAAIAAWQGRSPHAPAHSERLVSGDAAAQVTSMLQTAGRVIAERESKQILALYGIPVVQEKLTNSAEAAAMAAADLGFPVVLKVESEDLPHKTEAGVIRLNLRDAEAVRLAYDAVMANAGRVSPPPAIAGVLVQPMVPDGVEVILGARVDPLFGPLVVVGLGGILVELVKDSAIGLAPLGQADALALLHGLKGVAMLQGFRGSAPVDLTHLANLIARVSEFIADQQAIVTELDINPLICTGDQILAVDALIIRGN